MRRKEWTRALTRTAGLTVLPLAVACTGAPEAAEPQIGAVVVTQWNDFTEFFLEYPHPVAGTRTGNWAIHLTDLEDFAPISSGTLTISFTAPGDAGQTFLIEAPARDGIFLLDPAVERAGDYRVELALASPQVTSRHVLPEVRVYATLEEAPRAEEETAGTAIAFLKEQQWTIPFAVQPARERAVARTVSAPAEIVAPDGALAQASAPISGIALAASNQSAPSVGQLVSAGQLLVVLNSTSGEGSYARARGELERLEREATRAERLYAAGAIPEKRLEEAQHDLEIARAEVRAMGGGDVDGDFRLRVVAPISGVVAERSFIPGGRVEAGELLFTIVDPRVVWLKVQITTAAAAAITPETRAAFVVEGLGSHFQTTRLISVGSVLDTQTRTVPVVFQAANAGGVLKIGQFARATVPVGGTVSGVALPSEAILDDNGTPVAYVQAGGETFERRILTLGPSDATHTQVLEGIRPGEMVVTTGAYQVRLASMSGSAFAGAHAH